MSASGQFVQFLKRDIVERGQGRQRKSVSPRFAHRRQIRFLGDGASLMADPAIDGLVSRRSFTAERRRKSALPSARRKPAVPNRVRTATSLVRRR